jgi:type III pantothenate kinase
MSDVWFALVIGNSRYHWAKFVGERLDDYWHEGYQRSRKDILSHSCQGEGSRAASEQPIWAASVVPERTRQWEHLPNVHWVTLADVPLQGMYPTLGIDRALAVWGAIAQFGSPVLVIDAGTALTFTGADATQTLIGGAILPGVRLQFEALGQQTAIFANLTDSQPDISVLPRLTLADSRWALDTQNAIANGILYTLTAGIQTFIQDWWRQFPGSPIVMTGGDSPYLYRWLQREQPDLTTLVQIDECLIFQGIRMVRLAKS